MISLLDGVGPAKKKVPEKVFTLRLDVVGTSPRIWRRVLVRESMWMSSLHDSIQVIFDWFDYQTHVFTLDDLLLGSPVKRDDLTVEDDRDVTLSDLDLGNRRELRYGYNFGEGWQVTIKIEKVGPRQKGQVYPQCVAGARAGPPEDCGGLEAFHDLLACLKEPETDLGREWREWLGPDYDPTLCEMERINKSLGKLRK